MPKQLTVQEFANIVGLSARTIHRYIKAGTIIPRRNAFTKAAFFTVADVTKFQNNELIDWS